MCVVCVRSCKRDLSTVLTYDLPWTESPWHRHWFSLCVSSPFWLSRWLKWAHLACLNCALTASRMSWAATSKVIAAMDSKHRRHHPTEVLAVDAVKRVARNFGSASSTTKPASTCLERALMAIFQHPSSARIRLILPRPTLLLHLSKQATPVDTPSDCHLNSLGP